MSLRRLSGWEPSEITRFEYDDAGRMVAAVTTREPEFAPDDVAVLLASRQKEREVGPHGIPMAVATDPAMKPKIRVDMRVDFVAQALAAKRKQYEKDYPHQDQSGFRFEATIAD